MGLVLVNTPESFFFYLTFSLEATVFRLECTHVSNSGDGILWYFDVILISSEQMCTNKTLLYKTGLEKRGMRGLGEFAAEKSLLCYLPSSPSLFPQDRMAATKRCARLQSSHNLHGWLCCISAESEQTLGQASHRRSGLNAWGSLCRAQIFCVLSFFLLLLLFLV